MIAIPKESTALPLRSYQRAALDAVLERERSGISRQIVQLPTGGGKTVVAAHLIREYAAPRGWPSVMLVHRDELVRQSVDKLSQVNPDLAIGVVQADRDERHAPVIVASVQTLARPARRERLIRALHPDRLVIADEAHHAYARTWQETITALDPRLLLGITATPERGDKRGLGGIFTEVVYRVGMIELMAQGKLAPLVGLRIETDANLDGVHTVAGEFNERELSQAVDTPGRNRLIVDAWRKHAADRKRTVVFCTTVEHAEHVQAAFRDDGIDARVVFGHTPTAERQATLAGFHAGDFPVLVSVMVLTEGYDEPRMDCIILARPTKSRPLFVQMVGRGARIADGKADCLVIDLIDVTRQHKLVTFADLAAPDDAPDGERTIPDPRADGEQLDLLAYAAELRAVKERRAVAVDLFGRSPLVWMDLGGVRAAPAGTGLWLVLRPDGDADHFRPYLLRRGALWGDPATATPLFDRALDLGYAMGVAEERAAPLLDALPFVGRGAAWRQRAEPPTSRQLEMATKLRIRLDSSETKQSLSAKLDETFARRALARVQWEG